MAGKKSGGGFKTFLLILIVIVLSFFLISAAWLIVVPDSKIFGVSYASFNKNEVVEVAGSKTVLFTNYSKIIVDATSEGHGNARVQVNYGTGLSELRLVQNSKGFLKDGARDAYTLNVDASAGTLNIKLLEPNYNFVKLDSQTVLKINISAINEPNISNLDITIKTNNGSIYVGGNTDESLKAFDMSIKNLDLTSTSGRIVLNDVVDVTGSVALNSKNSSVNINDDISATTVSLASVKGRISTQDFSNADVSIESTKSHIVLGNVAGDLTLNTRSGTVEVQNVYGDFQTGSKIQNAYIKIAEIFGDASINNYETEISVKIDKIGGQTVVKAGSKSINIGEIGGYANITTKSGAITIVKPSTNTEDIILQTTSGTINASLYDIVGSNVFTTNSGTINVDYDSAKEFVLNASTTKGVIYWKGDKVENMSGHIVGVAPDASNNITASATSGRINLGWL